MKERRIQDHIFKLKKLQKNINNNKKKIYIAEKAFDKILQKFAKYTKENLTLFVTFLDKKGIKSGIMRTSGISGCLRVLTGHTNSQNEIQMKKNGKTQWCGLRY